MLNFRRGRKHISGVFRKHDRQRGRNISRRFPSVAVPFPRHVCAMRSPARSRGKFSYRGWKSGIARQTQPFSGRQKRRRVADGGLHNLSTPAEENCGKRTTFGADTLPTNEPLLVNYLGSFVTLLLDFTTTYRSFNVFIIITLESNEFPSLFLIEASSAKNHNYFRANLIFTMALEAKVG